MRQTGFTLLELMIALIVAGIAFAIALPNFENTVARSQVSTSVNNLVGAFNFARTEAAQRGERVGIGARSGTTDWGANGYLVWVDTDGDTVYDNTEFVVRLFDPVNTDLTLTSNRIATSFNGAGFSTQAMAMTLCSTDRAFNDRAVDLALSGRVNVSETPCP